MTSISISVSLQRACCSHQVIKKQQSHSRPRCSLEVKQATHSISAAESKRMLNISEQLDKTDLLSIDSKCVKHEPNDDMDAKSSVPIFQDERWKNGTWDLNMFVREGRIDWDGVIVAEAKRRKFLEMYPEAATNQAPVLFRSSLIPWWAWLKRFYLPEAELLNGRAAMVGFFMAYLVDALTGLDIVGQTGNSICKTGLFITVIAIIRRTQDIGNLQKLVDEATFYDKQWKATWEDRNATK